MYQFSFSLIFGWFIDNLERLIASLISILIIILLYLLIKKYINRLQKKQNVDETNAKNLQRFTKLILYSLELIFLALLFAEELSYFAGIISVAGATVIGFAAMSTLGNLIAGILIVVRKPFQVGDRVLYKNRITDVVDIKLVFTVMVDLNRVKIFIPNQKLLKVEIENYGLNEPIRREIFVTAGYDVDPRKVEKALLEVIEKFTNILKTPAPRVDLYEFLDFTIKYRLLFHISTSKIIPKIDYDVKKAIYYTFVDYDIDIETPMLLRNQKDLKTNE